MITWFVRFFVIAFLLMMLLWTVRVERPHQQRPIYSIEYLSHSHGGSVELPPDDPPTYCDGWASSFCTAP